jgi:hypothetical protein
LAGLVERRAAADQGTTDGTRPEGARDRPTADRELGLDLRADRTRDTNLLQLGYPPARR